MSELILGMPFDEYRALPGHNFSSLKNLAKSPLKYQHALQNPMQPTPAMELGSAVHCAVLEPHAFQQRYGLFDGTKRGAAWENWQHSNPGRIALKPDAWEDVLAMQAMVANVFPLRKGEAETTVTFDVFGEPCKGRIDWLHDDYLLDLKTCADCSPTGFGNASARYMYHAQMAWYRQGVYKATGEWLDAIIVAIENKAPFECAVYRLSEEALEYGWQECEELMQKLTHCRELDHWQGAVQGVQVLDLPGWYTAAEDSVEDIGLDFGE